MPLQAAQSTPVELRIAAIIASLSLISALGAIQGKSKAPAVSKAKSQLPTFEKFCGACHKGKDAPGGFNITKFKTEVSLRADASTWDRVVRALETKQMPPSGMPQPTSQVRQGLIDWVQATVTANCKLADPGRVTIRRLNREEYNNTIRDLFGLDLHPADDFPSDDVGYGFDNIGDVLSISPLLMEKYLNAAEMISAAAIHIPEPKTATIQAEELGQGNGEFAVLTTRGEFAFDRQLKPGMYSLKVRAFEDHAGPEHAKMLLALDNRPLQQIEVSATRKSPQVYEVPFKSEGGRTRISVSFLNDFYNPNNPPGDRDRNLWVDYLQIDGPKEGSYSIPESQKRIITSPPIKRKERESARQILKKFADRAYRRPATPEEVERLLLAFDLAAKYKEPFERGIQLGIQAALVSPNFLFRAEADPKNAAASRQVNGYELASRLSYFLWSTMPDDRLLMLAGDGSLLKAPVLETEVRRMLADPKARALSDSFASQWLTLKKLQIVNPDSKQFPEFTKAFRDDIATETKLFFNAIVKEDRSILDLIDGRFTYINESLAKHYGIPGVEGSQFRKVSLAGTPRGGVITQASVLTVTSNPTRTSPTKRGKWLLEQLLGTPPPPPPPGVDMLAADAKSVIGKTLRERMVAHRENPACANCHAKMDPLGFGLENFDPVGAWRTKEGELPIDSSGELPGGLKFNGPAQLRAILMKDKAQFTKAFSEKLLTYGLGRGLEASDRCHVDTIAKSVAASGYKFSALVLAIVKSDPFLKRRTR